MSTLRKLFFVLALGLGAGAQAQTPSPAAGTLIDATPRIAVISAFAPERAVLLPKLQDAKNYQVNGVEFTTGTLQGRPVVLFLSGISMTNAAMTTQLALDRFAITHIIVSGIAGGVNPHLHIGDVTIPQQWGQYLELLMARETAPGQYRLPGHMKDVGIANFGMMFPRPVEVVSAAQPQLTEKFWFPVDASLLQAAQKAAKKVKLLRCEADKCLIHQPRIVVGGNGVSGAAFVDNKVFREYVFATFQSNVLEMETAAIGHVAYANGVPYIALRSLSDMAGGGEAENEMGIFMHIAAENGARTLMALLQAWKPASQK